MRPFFLNQDVDQAIYKYISLKQRGQKKGGTSDIFLQALQLLKGELIVGFYKNPPAKNTSFCIIAHMLPADYQNLMRLDARLRQMENNIELVRKHHFRDIEILNFIKETENGKTSNWQALVKNTLIYGPDRQWLESCIARMQQDDLQSNSSPAQLKLTLTKHFIDDLVQPNQRAEAARSLSEQTAILKGMGFDSFQGLDVNVNFLANRAEIALNIKAKPMNHGIWQLLGDQALPVRHQLPYVPANIYSYQVIRLNFVPFWQELPEIFANVNPQLGRQFNMFLSYINNTLQINLSEDFVANLDNLFTNYSVLQGIKEMECFAWQLRNPLKISMALQKVFSKTSFIYATLQENLDISSHKGYTLYTIKAKLTEKKGQNPPISIAVVDRNLIFGVDDLVRSYINAANSRENQPDFYRSPLFNKMIRTVPEKAVGYGLMDFTKGVKTLLSILDLTSPQNSQSSTSTKSTANTAEEKVVDFSKLPSSNFISSFFSPGYNYILKEKDRIIIKTTMHYPKKR